MRPSRTTAPIRRLRSLLAAVGSCVLSLATVFPGPARALWNAGGFNLTPFRGVQGGARLAPDGAGGVFVSWNDTRSDSGGVYFQRVDLDGQVAAGWPVLGVHLGVPAGITQGAGLFPDGQGGALALVQAALPIHVDPGGTLLSADVIMREDWLVCVPDGRGGALALSMAWPAGNSRTYEASRFDPTTRNSVWWVAYHTSVFDWIVKLPRQISDDGLGGAYVVIQGYNNSTYNHTSLDELLVSHIDSTGTIQWGGQPVLVDSTGDPESLTQMAAPVRVGTGVVQLWLADRGSLATAIRARYVRADGQLRDGAGDPVPVRTVTPFDSRKTLVGAVPRAGGGAISAWCHDTGVGMYLRFVTVDSLGNLLGDTSTGSGGVVPGSPMLISDGQGGAYAAWTDSVAALGNHVLEARHVLASGLSDPAWPDTNLRVCDAPGARGAITGVVSGGGLVLAWSDERNALGDPSTGWDIYLARILPNGLVPMLLALVDARVQAGSVALDWYGEGATASAQVQRSADGAAWESIATIDRNGTGHFVYVDHDRAAGSAWAYRLAGLDGAPLTVPAWVTFGATPGELAIGGFVSGASGIAMRITQPGPEPARLEVYDVTGRRLASQTLAGGAGEHVVSLPGTWRSGVYFARLMQGGHAVARRAVLLR